MSKVNETIDEAEERFVNELACDGESAIRDATVSCSMDFEECNEVAVNEIVSGNDAASSMKSCTEELNSKMASWKAQQVAQDPLLLHHELNRQTDTGLKIDDEYCVTNNENDKAGADDNVSTIDPVSLSARVRHYLKHNEIQWNRFASLVLGVSQSRLSTLLSKPKPWNILSKRLQALYERMQLWMDTRATYGNNPYLKKKQVPTAVKQASKGKKKKARSLFELEENEKLLKSVTGAEENVKQQANCTDYTQIDGREMTVGASADHSHKCNFCNVCNLALTEGQTEADHILNKHVTYAEGLCDICGTEAKEDFVEHFRTHLKKVQTGNITDHVEVKDEIILIKEEVTEQISDEECSATAATKNERLSLNPFYGETV